MGRVLTELRSADGMLGRFCTGRVGMLRRFKPSVLPVFTLFIKLVCFYSSVGKSVWSVSAFAGVGTGPEKWCDELFDRIAFPELM